jgi:hypothetical protein
MLNRISWILILLTFAFSIIFWSSLPGIIPHFSDYFGVSYRWGGKGVLLFPAAGIVLMGFISLFIESSIPYFPVIVEDYAERRYFITRTHLALLKLWIASIIAFIEWVTIQLGRGNAQGLGQWMGVILFGTLALLLASYLIQIIRAR